MPQAEACEKPLNKVRQAGESDKLAKMAKEEADDALDDVESVGQPVPGFGGGIRKV